MWKNCIRKHVLRLYSFRLDCWQFRTRQFSTFSFILPSPLTQWSEELEKLSEGKCKNNDKIGTHNQGRWSRRVQTTDATRSDLKLLLLFLLSINLFIDGWLDSLSFRPWAPKLTVLLTKRQQLSHLSDKLIIVTDTNFESIHKKLALLYFRDCMWFESSRKSINSLFCIIKIFSLSKVKKKSWEAQLTMFKCT